MSVDTEAFVNSSVHNAVFMILMAEAMKKIAVFWDLM
jgi:hypothetical protein